MDWECQAKCQVAFKRSISDIVDLNIFPLHTTKITIYQSFSLTTVQSSIYVPAKKREKKMKIHY